MRSTNINFKRGILFIVYNATCWQENVRRSTHVFYIWNLFSNSFPLLLLLDRFRQLLLCTLIGRGRGRAREKRREKRVRGDGFWDSIPWLRWK